MRVDRIIGCGLAAFASLCLLWGGAKDKDAKRAPAPPKTGVKTPGIQIPFAGLKAEAEIPFEGSASGFAFPASVLIANSLRDSLIRLDAKTNKVTDPIAGLSKPCGGLVSAFGSVWSPNCGNQTISRIEAKSGKVTATVGAGVGAASSAIAANADSVWVLADDKTNLLRIDPQENTVVSELRLPAGCTSIVFGENSLWVTCPRESKVLRIDPKTNLVDQRIETASQPISAAIGEGAVWVLCKTEGKIAKIDPKTNKVTATIDLAIPGAEGNIAFGEGSVWTTAPGFPISRVDPQTDKVVQQFWGEGSGLLQTGLGSVWLAPTGKGSILRLDPKRIAATLAE